MKTHRYLALGLLGATLSLPISVLAEKSGEQVYKQSCAACHNNGVAGAPKPGDETEWIKRKTTGGGLEGLYKTAKIGKKAMPPKGTCGSCTDAELNAAVNHLVDGK